VTEARTGQRRRIGIDVVHLGRLERMHDELGSLLEARLWHPDERLAAEDMNAVGRLRYLAASLAVKEAWIKAVGRRPPGWVFSDASLVLSAAAAGDAAAVIAAFASDMRTTTPETGCLHADHRDGSQTPRDGQHAWYGVHDEWLIAGVAS
jgi:phosphopantetheine--protein transferase-like protein